MSAWCPQRVLACLLWLGFAIACAVGGTSAAVRGVDAVDVAAPLAMLDAAACDGSTPACPAAPGDRDSTDPMKRRQLARRPVPLAPLAADVAQEAASPWIVLPAASAGIAPPHADGRPSATRTTRNAQRRRHLRVLGGRAPPVSA